MIRTREAALLALTKLKTRKIRLFVIIFISSLLFSVLVAGSLIVRGGIASVESFGEEGFGKRFIVSASPAEVSPLELLENQQIINRAQDLHEDRIKQKTEEATRMGVVYDPATEPSPYNEYDDGSGRKRKSLSDTEVAMKALQEYMHAHPGPNVSDLERIAQKYMPKATYANQKIDFNDQSFKLRVIEDGKEQFEPSTTINEPQDTGLSSFVNNWQLMSRELLQPFVLEGANLDVGPDGSIPVIAPYSAVEQLLGLSPLPQDATSALKLDRLKELRTRAAGETFMACYRNTASIQAIDTALQLQNDIDHNKDKPDYTEPSYVLAVPDKPCGSIKVVKDTRTPYEKAELAKQEAFAQKFGAQKPMSQTARFRVVGVVPEFNLAYASDATNLLSFILISGLGVSDGWFTPYDFKASNDFVKKAFTDTFSITRLPNTYYVELQDAASAEALLKQSCNLEQLARSVEGPSVACERQGKPFLLYPFGSNSLAISDIKDGFNDVFKWAIIITAAVASLIMIAAVGRVIADSRRETAVFRAIGAKRVDISQIYITYALFVAALVLLISFVIGFAIALYVDQTYSKELTVQALVAFSANDLSRETHLLAFDLQDILLIIAAGLTAGLISALIPLMTNVRRNPIRDMRDDT